MKITGIETLLVDGGWDVWGFLKMTTDEGLVGWSEFKESGRPGVAAAPLPLEFRRRAHTYMARKLYPPRF